MALTCTKCQKTSVGMDPAGADSLFVCLSCAEELNMPAYRAEIEELGSTGSLTVSQKRRLAYLLKKVA